LEGLGRQGWRDSLVHAYTYFQPPKISGRPQPTNDVLEIEAIVAEKLYAGSKDRPVL